MQCHVQFVCNGTNEHEVVPTEASSKALPSPTWHCCLRGEHHPHRNCTRQGGFTEVTGRPWPMTCAQAPCTRLPWSRSWLITMGALVLPAPGHFHVLVQTSNQQPMTGADTSLACTADE